MDEKTITLNHLKSQRNADLARAEAFYDRERQRINRRYDIAEQQLRGGALLAETTAPTELHDDPPPAPDVNRLRMIGDRFACALLPIFKRGPR